MRRQNGEALVPVLVTIGVVLVILFYLFGYPQWNVWRMGLEGEANLARAEQERQIEIAQAKAEKEAATHRAEAIGIIGEAAKAYPEYRQQEFIGAFGEALREGNVNQIIYVPTEANIPIMEAGRVAR